MKKILVPLLLALAIILPTATSEAAYVLVPNFRAIKSNRIQEHIRFLGMEQYSHGGVNYTSWSYDCVDGNAREYVDKYIRRCSNRHDLELISEGGGDWYFVYTGSQAKYLQKLDGSFHMHVGRSGNSVVVNLVAGMYPES